MTLPAPSPTLAFMKTRNLTKRQQAVLAFITRFLEEEGRSPTLKEIAEGVGSSAVSTIHKHVQHLIEKGFLQRAHGSGNNIVPSLPAKNSPGSEPIHGKGETNSRPTGAQKEKPAGPMTGRATRSCAIYWLSRRYVSSAWAWASGA